MESAPRSIMFMGTQVTSQSKEVISVAFVHASTDGTEREALQIDMPIRCDVDPLDETLHILGIRTEQAMREWNQRSDKHGMETAGLWLEKVTRRKRTVPIILAGWRVTEQIQALVNDPFGGIHPIEDVPGFLSMPLDIFSSFRARYDIHKPDIFLAAQTMGISGKSPRSALDVALLTSAIHRSVRKAT